MYQGLEQPVVYPHELVDNLLAFCGFLSQTPNIQVFIKCTKLSTEMNMRVFVEKFFVRNGFCRIMNKKLYKKGLCLIIWGMNGIVDDWLVNVECLEMRC
jgi:hypothetical protein